MNRPVVTTVGTVLVAVALAACGSPSTGPAASVSDSSTTSSSPSDTTSASTDSSTTATGSTSTTVSPSATRPVPPIGAMHACSQDDLVVAAGRSIAATGHVGLTILFRNVSRTGCLVEGYPGVAGLD